MLARARDDNTSKTNVDEGEYSVAWGGCDLGTVVGKLLGTRSYLLIAREAADSKRTVVISAGA